MSVLTRELLAALESRYHARRDYRAFRVAVAADHLDRCASALGVRLVRSNDDTVWPGALPAEDRRWFSVAASRDGRRLAVDLGCVS